MSFKRASDVLMWSGAFLSALILSALLVLTVVGAWVTDLRLGLLATVLASPFLSMFASAIIELVRVALPKKGPTWR